MAKSFGTTTFAASLVAVLICGDAFGQTPTVDPPQGLDMTIDPRTVIDRDEFEELPSAAETDGGDDIYHSEKWRRMERIQAQGGERADMSRPASKNFKMNPVIGGRRQSGNPVRPGADAKPRLPFGLDFTREF